MEKVFTVKNPSGLHARPATLLVQKASSFPCEVTIVKGDKNINAKSIMGVMSLGIRQGEQLKVITSGEQEQEALNAVGEILETVFE
ncbi:HPr family phosphocarrier protein [Aneurinibacillus sp. Ricciae_BoGa-3]|uniref:HPr family phosphocarrier protein n=1 Tax=Aneurinibacillus sp. Ricciae_BoGa-3 TaxID=3022697 RepID=UPI00234187A0|nr:HPr family phosphocarrier protein [Aneurinibacillus sp. Ricciae_BoGa-3]WCK55881.1 HPr family phosphocarrier protein [Aneurinibacillus sp. Ricciae_BoGa-3]